MKTIISLFAASGVITSPVMAGPYVNIESNTSWTGNSHELSIIQNHVGYEGELGEKTAWFIEAGPSIVVFDEEDETVEFSGTTGIKYDVTERLNVYGEYAFLTGEDFGSAVKTGVKYKF